MHPHTAVDYTSTSLQYTWHHPLQFLLVSSNEIAPRDLVSLWSCDILGDFSHMLLMLHAVFRMQIGHYVGVTSPTSCVSVFQMVVVICNVNSHR